MGDKSGAQKQVRSRNIAPFVTLATLVAGVTLLGIGYKAKKTVPSNEELTRNQGL
ncbi:hypothetical protein KIN20_019189 [Parelaphostrongylus tenuis]|uniref:Uncharacterized protein n=1 Tax=Parelaphostrongylus tenuis TaxID=148309 RepID=A0AAD5N2V2_PARTN|nr:hypothetical protein KIN20_019189 [Parelaphostrongylus tenuis]